MRQAHSKQAQALFSRVVTLTPSAQAQYLRENCPDAALRAEVEKLLEGERLGRRSAAAQFASAATLPVGVEPRNPSTAGNDASLTNEIPGIDDALALAFSSSASSAPGLHHECIGPYKVISVLGEGGMGVVYLAEQQAPIHRRVALKLIKRGMDTAEVIARFESERQALALMSHPNIAKVYDAGTTEDGRPYFVMEPVPGEPITSYCDRQRLSTKERLGLFMAVCEAVQHAHQKAVIHRDLKPSNVLVMVEGGKPVPKVIDFGIAKATNQRLTEKTVYTEIGQIIGTPEYMSPEQAEMTAVDIDTRTDIYSLGVMLYELIVGALPFDRKVLREAGYAEIQRIIREKEPQKPSTRLSGLGKDSTLTAEKRRTDPRRLLREIQGDLDWIAMKALEKDRTRRYSTASDLAADITRHLSHEPVVAGPPGVGYRFKKFLRKNRGPVAAASILLLALVAGLAATTFMYLRAEQQRSDKEKALTEKESALREKTAANEEKEAALEQKTRALAEKEGALRRSEGMRLTAQSTAVLPSNPGLALLLGIEGAKRAPGLEASNALTGALRNLHEANTLRHTGAVLSASFSPDGRRVVTATLNDAGRIWDAGTGKELQVLRGDDHWGICVNFSPDGRRLVTGSAIWDAETGKEIIALRGHEGMVRSASFSPDGQRVVTSSQDSTARIWDAGTGKELLVLKHDDAIVSSASFSPDGRRVLTVSQPGTARIWDGETGKALLVLMPDGSEIPDFHSAGFSPDGRYVVSVGGGTTARIWNAETGKSLIVLRGHEAQVESASFSPDGRRVVTGSNDRTARIWDVGTGKEILVLRGHEDEVSSAGFSPDGRRVVTGSADKTARIWDVEGEKDTKDTTVLRGHKDWVVSASFSPDGQRVVTGSYDNTAKIWDAGTAKDLLILEGHGDDVYSASFSPDGQRVVTASADKTARIWDAGTGKELLILKGHEDRVTPASFSSDSRRVVTGSEDKTARIWDAGTGKKLLVLNGHQVGVSSASFSRDSRRVVTGSWDRTARIWDAETGKELLILKAHEAGVTSASFSPDGRRVVTASEDWTARIWDAVTGTVLITLRGHQDRVESASFSPDGQCVVTGSDDKTARTWDAGTGKELLVLKGHEDRVLSASFSPDGQRVVTGSWDTTARFWPLDFLPMAERRKPRDFTPEEIERYQVGTLEAPR